MSGENPRSGLWSRWARGEGRPKETRAGRTGRWGLRCLRTRSWPDRSALASAMGKLVLQRTHATFAGIGGLEGSTVVGFRCLAIVTTAVGGLGDPGAEGRRGGFGDDGRDETLEANRHGHGKPPRATREKPGRGSEGPAGGPIGTPSRNRPFPLGRSPGRPAQEPPGSSEDVPFAVPESRVAARWADPSDDPDEAYPTEARRASRFSFDLPPGGVGRIATRSEVKR